MITPEKYAPPIHRLFTFRPDIGVRFVRDGKPVIVAVRKDGEEGPQREG